MIGEIESSSEPDGSSTKMSSPFPGMDPYLEHPTLWEGFHSRCVVAIANRLQPKLDPRYIACVEERIFIEGPQQRIPDVWISQSPHVRAPEETEIALSAEDDVDTAVIVEVEPLEIHQKRIEILDSYNAMKLVTVIELLSPTNKRPGPGQDSYLKKQHQLLDSDCHLVEIDLLRSGARVLSIPNWKLQQFESFDYVVCVNRWPQRTRFEIYARRLQSPLPRIAIPLSAPDPDALLNLKATIEQVYDQARYSKRLRYDQPCVPALNQADREWATEQIQEKTSLDG